MLLMFATAAAWIGTLPGWPIGLIFFIVGTEIRVRVEDALLQTANAVRRALHSVAARGARVYPVHQIVLAPKCTGERRV